jgi:hypothetical protein
MLALIFIREYVTNAAGIESVELPWCEPMGCSGAGP